MICKDCGQEMLTADSCTKEHLTLGCAVVHRNTEYFDCGVRCHDCGIVNAKGNIHHLGCDVERCPICRRQLISCGCWEKLGLKLKAC